MTRVAVVGAHGQVGQRILNQLYVRGDEGVGIVRNPEHGEDLHRLGAESVVLDIESATADELAEALRGCDAVVFAAGAGAGSGAERKRTVDYAGSVLTAEAARIAGVRRFVQISAIGVDAPLAEDAEPVWAAYVQAKRDADERLRATDLDWTILRPGGLSNDEGTGSVTIGATVERGPISREDVAALVLAVLDRPATARRQWEVVGGPTPIAEALPAAPA
ncbi:MAG: family NAD(P)-dependent oxidoreductase [Naasia sp.]|jgi:uncharacterized protein YbjT (DUF2867 family)|uniref:SDR family oxidoreductase n=1 Tax=Naasia sp. TaxID=2546198 RepID=UPI00260DA2CF|nr:SDR family oxidoreductase [Naasia sp.]MCU1571070.1 family NAD(P)-dependent oxidoreductase [Naasia sp.]